MCGLICVRRYCLSRVSNHTGLWQISTLLSTQDLVWYPCSWRGCPPASDQKVLHRQIDAWNRLSIPAGWAWARKIDWRMQNSLGRRQGQASRKERNEVLWFRPSKIQTLIYSSRSKLQSRQNSLLRPFWCRGSKDVNLILGIHSCTTWIWTFPVQTIIFESLPARALMVIAVLVKHSLLRKGGSAITTSKLLCAALKSKGLLKSYLTKSDAKTLKRESNSKMKASSPDIFFLFRARYAEGHAKQATRIFRSLEFAIAISARTSLVSVVYQN